jgi:putative membrane protein
VKKFIRTLLGFIYGIVYGAAHLVPGGLSGGTFLVIFGCYETVCEAFALNRKEIKKHFLFLLFFVIGTVGGLIGFVRVITFLFDSYEIQTKLFFMGLILGGMPLISKIATKKEKFKPLCILPFMIGLVLVVSLFLIEKLGFVGTTAAQGYDLVFFIKIAVCGFFAAIAMVMPGISGAFVLVVLGVYGIFIEALTNFDIAIIVPAAIGILIGIVVGAKLVLAVIKKHTLFAYCAIMGMVVGSVAPLVPAGVGLNISTLAGFILLAAGAFIAVILGRRENIG